MVEIDLKNNPKRLKRPRILRATVPGESEKVSIIYELKPAHEKGKPNTERKVIDP